MGPSQAHHLSALHQHSDDDQPISLNSGRSHSKKKVHFEKDNWIIISFKHRTAIIFCKLLLK
jgi:hypothetical protein